MGVPDKVVCPHCRLFLAYNAELAGMPVECRHCAKQFKMPRLITMPVGALPEFSPALERADAPKTPDLNEPEELPPPLQNGPEPPLLERPPRLPPRDPRYSIPADSESAEFHPRRTAPTRPGLNVAGRGSQWATVAAGVRAIQVGYVILFVALVSAFFLLGPQYLITWPVPRPTANPEMHHATTSALLLGFLLILCGQAMCCFSAGSWSPLFALTAAILLLLTLFVHMASVVAFEGFQNRSPGAQVAVFLIRLFQAMTYLLSQLALLLYARKVLNYFRDAFTGRVLHVLLVMYVGYFLATLLGSGMIWLLFLEGGPGGFGNIRSGGDRVGLWLLLLCWGFGSTLLLILGLAIFQQIRSLLLAATGSASRSESL